MENVIDLGSELLVDRSTVRDPNVRLLAAALGEALARGSPWVAIHKRMLARVTMSAGRLPLAADAGRRGRVSTVNQKGRHLTTGEVRQ
jgi:hypothetical protein